MFVDGGEIQWRRLMTTIFGAGYLAIATGAVNFIVDSFQAVGRLYSALGGFLASLVTVLLGGPATMFDSSYAELQAWVSSAGLFSFALAVASVLLITYIGSWVINSVQ